MDLAAGRPDKGARLTETVHSHLSGGIEYPEDIDAKVEELKARRHLTPCVTRETTSDEREEVVVADASQ